MEIFPAIDLQQGQCVRLTQGNFEAATVYDSDPLRAAKTFFEAGARWLHVVDLDGAQAGDTRQIDLITRLAQRALLRLQVGGGIRDEAAIEHLLGSGVARVVIGSLAVKNPPLVKEWLTRFGPERIVIAFDVCFDEKKEPEVVTHGWQSGSQKSLWEVLGAYKGSGLRTILCTDVTRDGMLAGTNHALYFALRARHPQIDVLASGGVNGLADLRALAHIGVAGTVVGKALYEGRVDLGEAIRTFASPKAGTEAG
ncbi:MAG TPA: 1-(5-phosphoribosyl)-5-[(5-phosphoribosylamino)methylideneamino]imidazole-4-carboxamide isomerase [Alphaproteobacteria bacterium]|nr:1-(5-phosphoribosyl)-5-[(5-phosphoribosylamino)methylideneamino]imidazole-4-carboxamide isomerase [Alphaproteobacteria bacterium]